MNVDRVRQEIADARNYFEFVEGHPTTEGGVMALVALQADRVIYTLNIHFLEDYPYSMPEVYIRRPAIESSPHLYRNNKICYLHPHMWNPGRHNLTFVIQRTAKWLSKYEVFRRTRQWPGVGIDH